MEKKISVVGARVHNLKNISVDIPHGEFVVITGPSGSGKSSLAFDTIFAEGQRRYVESLSAYARQFLGRMEKPDVDAIHGISPAIAIEQKVMTGNPRSTVGTVTEVYDYLKVLYARIGRTFDPETRREVKKQSVNDVVNYIETLSMGIRFMLAAPLENDKHTKDRLRALKEEGFERLWVNGSPEMLEDYRVNLKDEVFLVIDRLAVSEELLEDKARLRDSIELTFIEGHGHMSVIDPKGKHERFSNKFELDGREFVEPSVAFFTFNNPFGACDTCEGFGSILGIDEDLVIPNRALSVFEGAVKPWTTESNKGWQKEFILLSESYDFPVHTPIEDLTKEEYDLLWNGAGDCYGINQFFDWVRSKYYKISNRILMAKYKGKTECKDCHGTRLRKDASYVKIDGHSIQELLLLPLDELYKVVSNLNLSDHERQVAKRVLVEIDQRLKFLLNVGLSYLTLNRQANTLSGGESQRINLATNLGSALVGSTYILDEPSIGLHPKDTLNLINVLHNLRDLGNTVIVVEHDEDIMREADRIIDIGPGSGVFGGEVVVNGRLDEVIEKGDSITASYLSGKLTVERPYKERKARNFIKVEGASEHNLKKLDVAIPLEVITVVTGVSGAGKSTLIGDVVYPQMMYQLGESTGKKGKVKSVSFDTSLVEQIEYVDQNPIGRSSRSNPATYSKAYDSIRELYARQGLAKARGLKPGYFSFNVEGGRCETCKGEGVIQISMQFMADVALTCEACHGKKFKQEALDIKYKDKDISEVLEMSISEALLFFSGEERLEQKIYNALKPLEDVGLGYLALGQSSSTLSGGEAQRVKLASFLIKGKRSKRTLFIFDEPTTGLHFEDVNKLIIALNALVEKGHHVLVIEHNLDVINCADWVIDIGPEGGVRGGHLSFTGTPEQLKADKTNVTGQALARK